MCDEAVNTCHSTMKFVPDCYKTQEMCDEAVSEDPFMLDKYKTQIMCDETADDSLATLKFIPDWFATSKMLEKLR